MSSGNLIRDSWEIVPVVLLLVAGGAIAVFSGVKRLGPVTSVRRLAGNASVVLVRTLLYVVALLAIQQMLGSAPGHGW